MKNASLIALEYASLMPADAVPENTKGYEGFIHLTDMEGSIEEAELDYIIRDHHMKKFEEKKQLMLSAADKINEKYGEGFCHAEIVDSYFNMREIIEQHMYIIDRAKKAMADVGITPDIVPIRGGTDGARLSFRGLPCPNLCTGGENFHSRFEFVSVEAMEKITDLLLQIVKNSVSEGIAE